METDIGVIYGNYEILHSLRWVIPVVLVICTESTNYVLDIQSELNYIIRSGTLSINYMFQPLCWPSSGCNNLYKVTIQGGA